MKKIVCIVMCMLLVLPLSSCGMISSISSIIDLFNNIDQTLPITLDDGKAKLEEMANSNGIEISFVFDDGETTTECTIGKKGSTQWKYITQNGSFNGFIAETNVNGTRVTTTTDSKTSGWEFSENITSTADMPDYFEENSDLIFYGHNYPIALFAEKETEVLIERSCTHYVFELGDAVEGLSDILGSLTSSEEGEEESSVEISDLDIEFWYDIELGLTLKARMSGTDSETEKTGTLYFEVTSISFAPEVPKGK